VPASVVIVGGGLMGLSTAWHLRRADPGVRVSVLERARPGVAASGASAAGVRVMGRDPAERSLALASLAWWPDLARELEGETGYRRGGGLRVALDDEAWREVPGWVAEQRAAGVPVDAIDASLALRLAPGLASGVRGGVFCALDGQAEAMPTVQAFAGAARRLGARVNDGVGAAAIVTERGRVVAVTRTDGARQPCDVVVVTAGVWSAPLLAPLGVRLPIETRALQMLLTEAAPAALDPVIGAFGRRLSLKQLDTGACLIGGGWPADITDQPANAWSLREDSVSASLAVAREVHPSTGRCALVRPALRSSTMKPASRLSIFWTYRVPFVLSSLVALVMSDWYLRRMWSVSLACSASMFSMPRRTRVRAQSSVSETEGCFFSSMLRIERTMRTIWSARWSLTSGTRVRTISFSRSSVG
jgi:sarcosine oxidase subunit beta